MITARILEIAASADNSDRLDDVVHMLEAYTISQVVEDVRIHNDIFDYVAELANSLNPDYEEEVGLLLAGVLLHYQDSPKHFLSALLATEVLDPTGEVLMTSPTFTFFYECAQPREILDAWAGFTFKISAHPDAPINEKRLIDAYVCALPVLNLPKIYDLVDSIDRGCGVSINQLFVSLATHLYISDKTKYYMLLKSKHEVFEIRTLIGRLSEIQKLEVAINTENELAKIECVRQVIYFRTSNDSVPEENIQLLADCIVSIANTNNELLAKFLVYFLEFPVRCPALYPALGKAIPRLSDLQIDLLVELMPIQFEHKDIPLYRRLLEEMALNASSSSLMRMLAGIYKRRQEFLFCTETPLINEPKYTNLGEFQINYLEKAPIELYIEHLKKLVRQLLDIRVQWHSSETEFESKLWIIISEIKLASLAFNSRGIQAAREEFGAFFESLDRYCNKSLVVVIMKHTPYEDVKKIINEIRGAFSLPLIE